MYKVMIRMYGNADIMVKCFDTYDEAMEVMRDPDIEAVVIFDKDDEVIL